MQYLQVKNLSKAFSEKPLVDNIDFTIQKWQKIALIAKNGAGKTTLLKMLMRELEPDDGEISFYKNMKLGFLSQISDIPEDMSVCDAIFLWSEADGKLLQEYENLVLDPDADSDRLHFLLDQIDKQNARDHEVKVKSIISQLNLEQFLDQRIGDLSWWEHKRICLAKVLLGEPDFLILDEPTNHLDLEMIERLEEYLTKSHITLLMVTHDRYFLEMVCTDIFELDRGKLYIYHGSYQEYLMKKADRISLENRNLHNMKQFYKSELERVRKMPRARQSKSIDRTNKFHDLHDEFRDKKSTAISEWVRLSLTIENRRLGGKVLRLHNVSKSFGDKKIVDNFSYDFANGERVGIVWPNGAGKSTFLNMLNGYEPVDNGSIDPWLTVKIGYYQQKHTIVDSEKTVLEYIRDVAESVTLTQWVKLTASQLLERFLFDPKKQQTRIYALSGGERRRLNLLMVLIRNPNVLILDEPTNDLDIETMTILEDFLLSYAGCLVIVSHDRFFMDKLVDHLLIFTWNGKIKDYRWSYTQYKLDTHISPKSKNNNTYINKKNNLTSSSEDNIQQPPSWLSNHEKMEFGSLIKEIQKLENRKEAINLIFIQNIDLEIDEVKKLWKELSEIDTNLSKKEARRFELAERE